MHWFLMNQKKSVLVMKIKCRKVPWELIIFYKYRYQIIKIIEVNLSAFAYRLFYEDFSSVFGAKCCGISTISIFYMQQFGRDSMWVALVISYLILCIKLSIEHSTTCDSKTNLDHMISDHITLVSLPSVLQLGQCLGPP